MPKDAIKKLGNPNLDKKQVVDMPLVRTEEEFDAQSEYIFGLKLEKLHELMNHFNIDPKLEDAWFRLAFDLAEHYVPGMQISQKKGQPKKWHFFSNVALYALVERVKINFPDLSRLEVFNKLPEEAQSTSLSVIIKPDTKPSTLETRYDRFVSSDEYILFNYRLENFAQDRQACLESLLTDSYKKILKRIIEKPHHLERLYHDFFMINFLKK